MQISVGPLRDAAATILDEPMPIVRWPRIILAHSDAYQEHDQTVARPESTSPAISRAGSLIAYTMQQDQTTIMMIAKGNRPLGLPPRHREFVNPCGRHSQHQSAEIDLH